jgi:demethylmenaquinone methyltransferase/2-methoxy-6-polyprenyl-1,4-benzoquinol methylase
MASTAVEFLREEFCGPMAIYGRRTASDVRGRPRESHRAPLTEFEKIAPDHPVFRVDTRSASDAAAKRRTTGARSGSVTVRSSTVRWVDGAREDDSVEALIAEQKTFYDLRAPDFGNAARPDRIGRSSLDPDVFRNLIAELDPRGKVLELACGTGWLTRELTRHADSVTAVDASRAMIERAGNEIDTDRVRFVAADVFDWTPADTHDVVCFSNWLSHVPLARFDDFWALVSTCLKPDGRVIFIDEDDRALGNDHRVSVGDVPAARRTLGDGRTFHVVKVFWSPDELEARLRMLGWTAHVRRLGETFLYGVAERANT